MTDRELFLNYEKKAKEKWFPKLAVLPKSKSILMIAINWLFNIFKSKEHKDWFLNRFWTTIGYKIYHPIKYKPEDIVNWWTLLHELIHCHQKKKWNVLFYLLYLWPISQGATLLFTCWLPVFWSSGWQLAVWMMSWLIVAGLHFIPQIPDPWRSHWEYQAYCLSMKTYYDRNNQLPDKYIDDLVELFTDMSYYQMEPNKEKMRKKLKSARIAILQNKTPAGSNPYYDIMIPFYKDNK